LLADFKRYHLKEQQRSKDPQHNKFVQKLANCEPITPEDLLCYKPLSKTDIQESPDEWKYASVLVSTNKERKNISRMKSRMWAEDNNTYVFKWPAQTEKFVN
jgi:hypothetical protein